MVADHSSPTAGNISEEEILVEECGQARVVILNRPKQLNALSLRMVERLKQLYEQWDDDNNISLIIIKGYGRAFCAGGDVAATCRDGNDGNYSLAKDFFCTEYKLNYIVGTLNKPHVALLDGIVMGGGSGVSIHGHIRIATEKTVFSMPETALGLHPDVGASHFLSRLPGYLGEFLGLTGARLDGADMLACGLATHFVPSNLLMELEKALKGFTEGSVEDLSSLVDEFTMKSILHEKSPLHRLPDINRCFAKTTMEKILEALDLEGESCQGWSKAAADRLRMASPLSLKITLKSIRQGRHQSLPDCLKQEYRLSVRCVARSMSNDFYEGVRAILVDKDRNPRWSPPALELVTPMMVDYYYSPLRDGDRELQLPVRSGGHGSNKVEGRARL